MKNIFVGKVKTAEVAEKAKKAEVVKGLDKDLPIASSWTSIIYNSKIITKSNIYTKPKITKYIYKQIPIKPKDIILPKDIDRINNNKDLQIMKSLNASKL